MTAPPARCRDEDWLEAHLDLVAGAAAEPLLELGCGEGRDTVWLTRRHSRVVACDIAMPALIACGERAPAATRIRLDVGRPLPFVTGSFRLAVASLSLHYFGAELTHRVVADVCRCLAPGGHLVCRVNSVRDVRFGARGHPEIERHFYRVRERSKRFFDGADLDAFFGPGFTCLACAERMIDRYGRPKVVWELRLRKR